MEQRYNTKQVFCVKIIVEFFRALFSMRLIGSICCIASLMYRSINDLSNVYTLHMYVNI